MSISDRGSAPVEFLAFGIPGLLLLVIGFQLIWSGYLANVAFDAACEGAAAAAVADSTPRAGEQEASTILAALAGISQHQVDVSQGLEGDRATSVAVVKVFSPLLGFGMIPIVETAEAINERTNF